jgi:pyruvate kinase
VITATQMLESMIHAPSPTRAEATDVANAVFDGTDALMLSGETAIGHDPALTVRTMAHIAQRAEDEADYVAWGGRLGKLQRQAELDAELSLTAAMTHAAWRAAADAGAQAIICCTRSGTTARAVARFRPLPHLLGLTTSERTARQLSLTWGARSVLMDDAGSPDAMAAAAIAAACAHGHVNTGDVVAVLTGVPGGTGIDSLRIVRVGASRSAG